MSGNLLFGEVKHHKRLLMMFISLIKLVDLQGNQSIVAIDRQINPSERLWKEKLKSRSNFMKWLLQINYHPKWRFRQIESTAKVVEIATEDLQTFIRTKQRTILTRYSLLKITMWDLVRAFQPMLIDNMVEMINWQV